MGQMHAKSQCVILVTCRCVMCLSFLKEMLATRYFLEPFTPDPPPLPPVLNIVKDCFLEITN